MLACSASWNQSLNSKTQQVWDVIREAQRTFAPSVPPPPPPSPSALATFSPLQPLICLLSLSPRLQCFWFISTPAMICNKMCHNEVYGVRYCDACCMPWCARQWATVQTPAVPGPSLRTAAADGNCLSENKVLDFRSPKKLSQRKQLLYTGFQPNTKQRQFGIFIVPKGPLRGQRPIVRGATDM